MTRYVMPSIRKKVIERDMKCVYCGLPVFTVVGEDAPYNKRWKAYDANGKTFHFEHHKPHALGGVNDETNINLACERCNLEKARKEAAQIAASKGAPMLHTIKVSEDVYNRLQEFQGKHESFSEAVLRLLVLMEKMGELKNILEGGKRFSEWQREQIEKEAAVER